MDGRVAQGGQGARAQPATSGDRDWLSPTTLGFALVLFAILVYSASGTVRFYNHFVWQALAFLQGRAEIDFPVGPSGGSHGNAFFQDVLPILDATGQPSGRGLLPFPPLPAVVLLPFVAVFGLATDQRIVSVVAGAIDVGLAYWMVGRLPISPRARFLAAIFFGFGTVVWYAAQLGTTWFLAHVISLTALLAAVGLAISRDPASVVEEPVSRADARGRQRPGPALRDLLRAPWRLLDRHQVAVGLLFGLACTARLSIAFGAPFFVLVGGGGSWLRRAVSAGLGAAIPIGGLLVYNLATTGRLLHPAYDYMYRLEAVGYPGLNYHPEWSLEDARYLPQNIMIALFSMPAILPDAVPAALGGGQQLCLEPGSVRGLFSEACPLALPRDVGMSLFLTSPAYLLAIPVVMRQYARSRLVTGAAIAVLAIALINVMHFSQGWVQFGYRFSNDFVAFALVLVALGMAAPGRRKLALSAALVVASVAINFWGTWWGMTLRW